jgi:hypothetical protein
MALYRPEVPQISSLTVGLQFPALAVQTEWSQRTLFAIQYSFEKLVCKTLYPNDVSGNHSVDECLYVIHLGMLARGAEIGTKAKGRWAKD